MHYEKLLTGIGIFCCLALLNSVIYADDLVDERDKPFEVAIGTDLLVQWKVEAGIQFGKGFSMVGGMGILTPPYSDAILAIVKGLSPDTETYRLLYDVIDEAFTFGFVWELGFRYQLAKIPLYWGLHFSHIILNGSINSSELATVTGISIPEPESSGPGRFRDRNQNTGDLGAEMASHLFNLKLTLIGYHWEFHPSWYLNSEFFLMKTIAAPSTFDLFLTDSSGQVISDLEDLESATATQAAFDELSQWLYEEAYLPYVWVPTVTLMVGYKF